MPSPRQIEAFETLLMEAQGPEVSHDILSRIFSEHQRFPAQMGELIHSNPVLLKQLRSYAEDKAEHLHLPLMHRRRSWYRIDKTSHSTIKLANHKKVGPLTLLRLFMKGSLGSETYVARHEEGYLCLFKRYFPEAVDLSPDEMFRHQERMIQRLNLIEDPRIEEVLDHFLWKENSYVQIKPYLYCCSLYEWMNHVTERKFRVLLLQRIGEALKVLHQNNIAHMDLKPEQFLILRKPTEATWQEEPEFVLIDYDFSMIDGMLTLAVGSAPYYAPEQFADEPLLTHDSGVKADIYAYCVLIHRTLSERFPFGDGQTQQSWLDGMKQSPWVSTFFIPHKPLRKILKAGVHPQPEKRPQLDEILNVLKDPTLIEQLHLFPTHRDEPSYDFSSLLTVFKVIVFLGFIALSLVYLPKKVAEIVIAILLTLGFARLLSKYF